MPTPRPDMPERVSNARIILWLQIAVLGCLTTITLPGYFPTASTIEQYAYTQTEVSVVHTAGIIAIGHLVLSLLCAILFGRGYAWVYVVLLGLQALVVLSAALTRNWTSIPTLAAAVAVVWILVTRQAREWFFRPRA